MSNFKIKFRGTRGSYPTPKSEFLKFGGNTSCVEIQAGNNLIILDGGYGIVDLGQELALKKDPLKATILLSHNHMDHIQGLPFFKPLHIKTSEISIFGLCEKDENLKNSLSNFLFGKSFPLGLDEINCKLNIKNFSEDKIIILNNNDLRIELAENLNNIKLNDDDVLISSYKALTHPKEGSLSIKIKYKGKSVVYATDIENSNDERFIKFAHGVDLLIHDAQYTSEEYNSIENSKKGYGHSTFEMAIENAKKTEARELIFFHYDPCYNDEKLSSLEDKYTKISPNYKFAKENLEIIL